MPTLDTARYTYLLDTLLTHNKPTLFVGPTGTGKTVYVQKLLLGLNAKEWSSIFINYSAQTSANQSQDIIDGKLDKRRKGVFGPPMGKRCVILYARRTPKRRPWPVVCAALSVPRWSACGAASTTSTCLRSRPMARSRRLS